MARRVTHLMGKSSGGIRKQVLRLAASPPDGFETAGIVGPEALKDYFAGHHFTPWQGMRPWTYSRPDVLHAHGLTAAARAAAGLVGRSTPLVVTIHTARSQTLRAGAPLGRFRLVQPLLWAAGLLAIRKAAAVIVPSAEMAAAVKGAVVIPPPIDLPQAAKSRAVVRREMGTPADTVVVLAVARLHPDKAPEVFIEALAGTGAQGWIAGDGPERRRLEQLAKDSSVRLLGERSDVGSLLGAADIFALPARGEAYGFAVLEAVAAGLPVVATRTGAVAELVGDAGIIVDPHDTAAFIDAVRRLIAEKDLRARLAENARGRKLPSADALTKQLGDVYDQVLKGPLKTE